MFISYAQNFEDVILWRALKHVGLGFYVDVGAQDPMIDSVSLAFYEKGWRGIHVEPNSQYANKLREARPDEQVIDAVIGRDAGEIPFFEIQNTGLSTGDEGIAQAHEARGFSVKTVMKPCKPLSAILDIYKDQDVHWLKIDVEGMECAVIDSWKPSQLRPWIVVVEATQPLSAEQDSEKWEPGLIALGYEFAYFDGLNRFYVSNAHPELREYFGPGPNVFDDFALSGSASAPFCRKVIADHPEPEAVLKAENRAKAALEAEIRHTKAALHANLTDARRVQTDLERRLAEAHEAEAALRTQISQICASKSWRVTKPARIAATMGRRLAAGLAFRRGSRPQRAARQMILWLVHVIRGNPALTTQARFVFRRLPTAMQAKLLLIVSAPPPAAEAATVWQAPDLSPRARRIYAMLKTAEEYRKVA